MSSNVHRARVAVQTSARASSACQPLQLARGGRGGSSCLRTPPSDALGFHHGCVAIQAHAMQEARNYRKDARIAILGCSLLSCFGLVTNARVRKGVPRS